MNTNNWQPIATAPQDGSKIIVYCPPAHGLPHMVSFCSWHDCAGFCVDELREPTMWSPIPDDQPQVASTQERSSYSSDNPAAAQAVEDPKGPKGIPFGQRLTCTNCGEFCTDHHVATDSTIWCPECVELIEFR